MKEEKETEFFKCSCGSEVLSIEHDKETNTYDICMYETLHRWDFMNRIKHIWRILKHGSPYNDYMVLDKKSAIELANFIRKH